GGLVLGVGAAITLAVWTDDEFATGSFEAGTFEFQGSADGDTFSDNPEAPGQPITFGVEAENLSPGDSVSGAYTVLVTENSTDDATVALSDGESDPAAGLTYSMVETEEHGCESPEIGEEIIGDDPLGV